MADALDNFAALAPANQPRAYVLGCMEELGDRAADYHRELGRRLRLRPDDRLFIVGDQAPALRDGLLEGGNGAGQIEVVDDLESVAAFLAAFRGALFLKGSRRYQLERVLAVSAPAEAVPC
jgi:UDP-N-acetylmuramoyl-tripeptide--D-alanyl-D-alanine ligase